MGFFGRLRNVVRVVVKPARKALSPINKTIKSVRKSAVQALPKPIAAVVKKTTALAKNPAKKIVPVKVRKSGMYTSVVRPIFKVGTGVAVGAVTGGIGLSTMAFSGLSVAGGIAGGAVSAVNHGLDSSAFQPGTQILAPAVAGFAAGNAAIIKDYAVGAAKKEVAKATAPKSLGKAAGKFLATSTAGAGKQPVKSSPIVDVSGVVSDNATGAMQVSNINMADVLLLAGMGALVAGPVGALVGGAAGLYVPKKQKTNKVV